MKLIYSINSKIFLVALVIVILFSNCKQKLQMEGHGDELTNTNDKRLYSYPICFYYSIYTKDDPIFEAVKNGKGIGGK